MCWIPKIFLLKTMMEYINYVRAEELCLYILKSIQKENPANNPLYYAPNLLLLSCNLIEICRIITNKFDFLGAYTQKVENLVAKIASGFIENIEDEFQLRALVFEKDYENRGK